MGISADEVKAEEPLTLTNHPFKYDFKSLYPDAKLVAGWEGGGALHAEKDGKFILIIDNGTLADFIEDDEDPLLQELICIATFATAEGRAAQTPKGSAHLFEEETECPPETSESA